MFLHQGPITMSVIVLVIVLQVLLFRSRWGLRTRAVGEHPKAAETVGIDVIRLRYRNVILGGLFAGLGGAWFTLDFGSSFQNGHDQRPRLHRAGGADLRALASHRSLRGGAAVRRGGLAGHRHPDDAAARPAGRDPVAPSREQVFPSLPYVITIIVLAGVVGRSIPPAAVGQPYETGRTRLTVDDRRRCQAAMTTSRAARAVDMLDLEEGRRARLPVSRRRRRSATCSRSARRIAMVGASSNPRGRRTA